MLTNVTVWIPENECYGIINRSDFISLYQLCVLVIKNKLRAMVYKSKKNIIFAAETCLTAALYVAVC